MKTDDRRWAGGKTARNGTDDHRSIRVTVVATNPALRRGLSSLLAEEPGLEIIGEAADLMEAVDQKNHTDVLILCSETALRGWNLPVVLITDNPQAGAGLPESPSGWAILDTGTDSKALISAVHAVANGLTVGSPGRIEALLRIASLQAPPAEPLSPREIEVLELISRGLANKQIAGELNISENTVKFHISSIFGKLTVNNRTEAVRLGIQQGFIVL